MSALVRYLGRHHVGLLALFVALSGSAYAAGVARNSVGTAQLKRNAVTSPKVKNGSLRIRDFKTSDRFALRGPAGAAGAAGATGPAGPKGDPGALIDATTPARADRTPPAQPDHQSPPLNFTLPTGGKVSVSGDVSIAGACPMSSATSCVFDTGLYVDGQPVPGSGALGFSVPPGFGVDDCTDEFAASFGSDGVKAGLGAGSHTLTVGIKQTAGETGPITFCPPDLEAIGPYQ